MNSLKRILLASFIIGAGCFSGCLSMNTPKGTIHKSAFGRTPDGQEVDMYTLKNTAGGEVSILTYGGIVQSLRMPDKNGVNEDIVLGYDSLEGYLQSSPYFGCLVGRYGNRIGGAQFVLNGKTFKLAANNGPNSLHGGIRGFDKVVWAARALPTAKGPSLVLTCVSLDGDEGFPGNLEVTAIYTLTEDNELKLEFSAQTDQPTIFNPTHHSYFNLAGQGDGDILGHVVQINSELVTPVDKDLIPTGAFADVKGTPFDFRKPTAIGNRINDPDPVLQYGPGYDHNWVINKPAGWYGLQARVTEPKSGRVMEVWSTEPGLQFYAGNFLDGSITGKGGKTYQRRTGFCMEPQHYPDSPNKPNFPSVVLLPGQKFNSTITYKFSTSR